MSFDFNCSNHISGLSTRYLLTLELIMQDVNGGHNRGVDVVQPGSQALPVVELLERLEGGVVATG